MGERKKYKRVVERNRRDGACPRCGDGTKRQEGRPWCREHMRLYQRAYRARTGRGSPEPTVEERKANAMCPRCRMAPKEVKGYCGPCGAARLREWRRREVKTPRVTRAVAPEVMAERVGAPSMAWLRRVG